MALAFSEVTAKKIAEVRTRYPDSQAACMPVLHMAQEEFGCLSDEAVGLVAKTLGLPESHVFGVITFYTMFHRHAVGKHVLMVCTNVSCMLEGGYEVLEKIEKKLGVRRGETTPDGRFTIVEEECLAACADAPATVCKGKYFLKLDPAKVDAMIDEIAKGA